MVPQNYTAPLSRDIMTIINTDVPLLKLQYMEHNIAWIKDVLFNVDWLYTSNFHGVVMQMVKYSVAVY